MWISLACNTPEAIPDALRARIGRARADGYDTILIGYADCGTGGRIDPVCAGERVERIPGPHRYAFFDGLAHFT